MGLLDRYRGVTPYMVFCCLTYLSGALLYGIDTGSFGSLQALPSFLSKFGTYDAAKKAYVLPSNISAAANSIPFAGQALGAFLSSFVVDWFGYRVTMVVLALIQIVAIIIELTSVYTGAWGQLTAGRFLAYTSTGLAEMAVTSFNSEVSPASTRGLLAGSMLLFNALGNLWGAGMSRAYATDKGQKGWMIPTGVQLIPAALILIFIWFTVESPRWLIIKGKREEALQSLNRLRPKEDVDRGYTKLEVDAIEQSLQEQGGLDQGQWLDLFRPRYLRRTLIAWSLFAFLQMTGIQFVNTFGATFYVANGLGANSFTYVVLGNVGSIVACIFQILTYDIFGRRFFSIVGGLLCGIFLTVVSTLGTGGTHPNRSSAAINATIASVILTQTFGRFAITNAFVISGEIGGTKMRKKILGTAGVWNMVFAIMVTAITPYLMNVAPGSAGLQAKTGFFFVAPSFLLFLYGIFIIPELKGRSLEEVDELFDAGLQAWQFSKYKTKGTGALIAGLQDNDREKLRRVSITDGGVGEKVPEVLQDGDSREDSV